MNQSLKNIKSRKGNLVRTQISLTPSLKMYVDKQADIQGISMSAYIRETLINKMEDENSAKKKRLDAVDAFVGSGMGNNAWGKTKKSVLKWQRKIRKDRDVLN